MSYILEALKKAQAERQLGNSPTLHAPTLQSMDRSSAAARLKKPLLLVIVAMSVVIAALLFIVLKPAAAPADAPAAPVFATQTPVQVVADNSAPLPAPVAALPPPVATLTPAPRKHADPQTMPAAPAPAANANPSAAPPAPSKPAVAFEEPVQNLRDLPEPIQRSIPQVAVGGYIYSKNPSDRLLLIDKVLRREGDEVAPGLKLEKLNPKEAVFNFKGYRYRVPY
ncbi:general secretion pathway protein GspB [Oxalobacteraceae bacterium OTU3CINTB1]|nr:general secretion pathway protein GspB [Oxalobacteraceae bacterium OTU3CINTB1]